jgi:hypothetical protein
MKKDTALSISIEDLFTRVSGQLSLSPRGGLGAIDIIIASEA